MSGGRPADGDYAPFYARYVALVPEGEAVGVLESQPAEIERLARSVAPDREGHRYAPDKWSVRQVLGHLVDGERVFGYRAFCIARGEQAALPSFDENAYVAASAYDRVGLAELVREFALVRESNLVALRRLDAGAWGRFGRASGKPVSVRALAYVMAGHVRHHQGILRERYGVA